MFFDFGIKDIIDILLVALLLYNIYRLMKESRSLNVFIGIMVFVVCAVITLVAFNIVTRGNQEEAMQ